MDRVQLLLWPIVVLLLVVLVWQQNSHDKLAQENARLKSSLESLTLDVKESLISASSISQNITATSSTIEHEVVPPEGVQLAMSKESLESISNDETSVAKSGKDELVPFEQQTIDYNWAYNTETAISDVFLTHEYLENMSLENIECRTTTCQIRVKKSSGDSLHQTSLVMMALETIGIDTVSNISLGLTEQADVIQFEINPYEKR